jgi:hypothetical protein
LTIYHRPESIGEGICRLYISDKFKNADPDLLRRVNHVAQELEDIAFELAQRAGYKVHRRKRQRTNALDGPTGAGHQATPSVPPGDSTSHLMSTNSTASGIMPPENQTSTHPSHNDAVLNSGGSSSSDVSGPPDESAIPSSKQFGTEQSEIESIVRALVYVSPVVTPTKY